VSLSRVNQLANSPDFKVGFGRADDAAADVDGLEPGQHLWDRTCELVPVVLGTSVELVDIADAFEVNPFVS
jgi:hypothetical protein